MDQPGFTVHRFPLPPGLLANGGDAGAILTLRTPTFVPMAAGLNEDDRELGIALDWVAIETDRPKSRSGAVLFGVE
ncbi:hypothetical protein [Candidatus Methylomirabilis sp.]|uniref:hypothetical protein n=1 Tax=Candidatus Methylomirabilis sp. TaxID=2032687 RepID=UPI0030762EA5